MNTLTVKTRKLIPMLGLAMMLGMSACGDESEGKASINDSAPAQVSDVNYVAGPGEGTLTWKIPASESFMYSKVVYKNAKGEEVYKMYSKDHAKDGIMTETIGGFASVDPVDFNIYACSVRGNHLEAQKISAVPGAPAFLAVAQSIDAEPAWGGVSVSYNNETVASVNVVLKYHLKSDASKSGEYSFVAAPNTNSSQFVGLTVSNNEFINGEEAVIELAAADADGNSSEPRTIETRTKRVEKLDRTNWTFPGFADNYDAQIGYSSQEAGGEGGFPRGRVVAMLDGDEGTFWHTSWKQPSSYPHFFIIDMGEEKTVSNVTIRRRGGNNGTNIGQTFYTCTTASANGSSPDEWGWVNQGWYPFDRNSDAHQLFGMTQVENTRYIKVYFSEKDKGGDFVMISEFNAYTPAE